MVRNWQRAWHQRSLPTSFVGLRGIRTVSYSQFGEDAIARPIIGDRATPGIYVDVGCFHPVQWSNTYALYLEGWAGLCLDANPRFAQAWQSIRPRDRFLNLAISSEQAEVFYVEDTAAPAMNRVVTSIETTMVKGRKIETKRLVEVCADHWGESARIDLMSIDCEGHDLSVLMSNDFRRFRPRVLIVEDTAPLGEGAVHRFCVAQGYILAAATELSRVYQDTTKGLEVSG